MNEAEVGDLVARHLLETGFRHFAFVGHLEHEASAQRLAQFRRVLSAVGVVPSVYNVPADMTMNFRGGQMWTLDRGFGRWLAALTKPVAIFCANDQAALGLSEVCRLAGLRVPEDVALVGVDNDDILCELARPALSSVELPGERVGYEAAAMLDRMMQGEPSSRAPVLFSPLRVVVRQSSDLLMIDDPDTARALRFIREHCHEPLQVADVLRAVPVSRRSLQLRFRMILKRTISDEIHRVQLERARQLLSGTDLSIAQVAEHSGFANASQLGVAFRRHLRCTPTTYRRRNRSL